MFVEPNEISEQILTSIPDLPGRPAGFRGRSRCPLRTPHRPPPQTPGAAANNSGLGLGLYIASEIAKVHGGEIAVDALENRPVFYGESTQDPACGLLARPMDRFGSISVSHPRAHFHGGVCQFERLVLTNCLVPRPSF